MIPDRSARSFFWMAGFLLILLGCRAGPDSNPGSWEPWPKTAPELTDARRTTTHAELEAFLDAVVARSPLLHRQVLAQTPGGRSLPAVIAASPPIKTAAAARASGKPSVLFVANIHGGEVENKEVALMLLREIAQGQHAEVLRAVNLVFVPDFNPDGNDAFELRSRPEQAGPVMGVGRRTNAAGLDLNRDFMKLEAVETRALVRLLTELDPVLLIDGHTTDGSYHGFDVTYAGPLSPATDPGILNFVRGAFLPLLRKRCLEHEVPTFDYGNFETGNTPEGLPIWSTFEAGPRFQTNYVGLRNRLSLLVETYAHAPFARRIRTARVFVLEALRLAALHSGTMVDLTRAADQRLESSEVSVRVPLLAKLAAGEVTLIPRSSVNKVQDEVTGTTWLEDSGERTNAPALARVHFDGENEIEVPPGYLVRASDHKVMELLTAHGIRAEALREPAAVRAQAFRLQSEERSRWPFQGHHLVTLRGTWEDQTIEAAPGDWWIPSFQPLGRVLVFLLEPESPDGVAAWDLLSPRGPEGEKRWPIFRLLENPTKIVR